MDKKLYDQAEKYMRERMKDSVHDALHVYRVLNYAMQIIEGTEGIHCDVVILAALLHDIGRQDEYEHPNRRHAQVGSERAYDFLVRAGLSDAMAAHVADCIRSHSYRGNIAPESVEAKVIFDADKLDLTGSVGVVRAVLYGGQIQEPIYLLDERNLPANASSDDPPSLFREYRRKLQLLYTGFHTEKAREIAQRHQQSMDSFFSSLYDEVSANHDVGNALLKKYLRP